MQTSLDPPPPDGQFPGIKSPADKIKTLESLAVSVEIRDEYRQRQYRSQRFNSTREVLLHHLIVDRLTLPEFQQKVQTRASSTAVGIVRTLEQQRRQRRRLTVGPEPSSLQATRWTRNRSGSWLVEREIWPCLSHLLAPLESRLAGRAPSVCLTASLRTPSPGRLGRRKARDDGVSKPLSIGILRCALLSQPGLNDTGSCYLTANPLLPPRILDKTTCKATGGACLTLRQVPGLAYQAPPVA